MTILMFVFLGIGAAAYVWSQISLERLLKFQSEHHPDGLQGRRFAGTLLFKTPVCAVAHSSCRAWLKIYRITTAVWFAVMGAAFAFLIHHGEVAI